MISNKVFAMNMDLLSLNFDFAIKDGYDSFIYNLIKDKTNDEQFSKMIQDVILSTTKEEWNKKYGFSGVMSAADFIRLLKSENSAEDEVELLITKANFITDKIPTFQNQITQLVANSRIKQVRFDLYDNYNPNKRSRDVIKKELISLWNITKNNYNQDRKNLVAIEGEVKANEDNSSDYMIENLILEFLINNKAKCQTALKDGWLGVPWKKDKGGLIAYIRFSFHMQNKILLLNKKQITEKDYCLAIPFDFCDAKLIIPFFKSEDFKNEVIKNDKLKPLYDTKHFDIIKKRNSYTFKNTSIEDFINAFKKSINN